MSCLIGAVNEASAGAFDVFDAGVGGLDLACGGARHDEKFDLFPQIGRASCRERVF